MKEYEKIVYVRLLLIILNKFCYNSFRSCRIIWKLDKGGFSVGIRKRFENILAELEQELLDMYHLAKANLTKSMEALVNKDLEKAKEVIASDDTIDEKEKEINNKAILLIAQQAPVATDLRRIIVA